MARALLAALQMCDVKADVASHLQTRDGTGDAQIQAEKQAAASVEIDALIQKGRQAGWRFWITYHNYYKAPDLIGPAVARALQIPYLLVEATRARKRLSGPWADYAKAAEAASDAAAVIFYLTLRDKEALRNYAATDQKLIHLRPFLPRENLPPIGRKERSMLSVGMFRKGDKLASYEIIAETLAKLQTPDWHLEIAGDGPARAEVEALFAPFSNKISFLGALSAQDLQDAYARAKILFWPGVNEAFGMTYLEAQAAGMAVVAQNRPGVRDVLAPGADYPSPEAGSGALAARLDMLLEMPKLTMHLGAAARAHVGAHHLLGSARTTLRTAIDEILI
ncbi:glycosyltransferase family 4 protein [Roseobacter litoralis]|uniref:Glycosyltransferase-like protein n=1 Tax=Roseobacter litoralis (strain ATCC 49566 / DSM 6996 / JCM 21268 / NBRC 15278 / OCh 149) TaxID=391595 RepID=F7ZGL9_ROSLO|nr:glycosyltransferase family 4 protein [Roseobacter litoralis]AEI92319.1 glycosyltransferase-like protein [Roseobacter litoralis Och 149]